MLNGKEDFTRETTKIKVSINSNGIFENPRGWLLNYDIPYLVDPRSSGCVLVEIVINDLFYLYDNKKM